MPMSLNSASDTLSLSAWPQGLAESAHVHLEEEAALRFKLLSERSNSGLRIAQKGRTMTEADGLKVNAGELPYGPDFLGNVSREQPGRQAQAKSMDKEVADYHRAVLLQK